MSICIRMTLNKFELNWIPKMYSKKKYPVYFCCCVECLRRIQFLICMQMRVVIHIISAFYLSFWLSAVCFFFFICCTGMRTKWDLFSAIFAEFFSFIQPTSRWRIIAALHGARFFFVGVLSRKKTTPTMAQWTWNGNNSNMEFVCVLKVIPQLVNKL